MLALVDGEESLGDVVLAEGADGTAMGAYAVAVVDEQGRDGMDVICKGYPPRRTSGK